MLQSEEITYVVLARNATNEPHRLIAASIGVAIPSEEHQYGYLSEHYYFGETEEIAGDYSEDLAASMLATTMGVAFDPATAWDERKQLFMSSGLIIKTADVTQSATGDKTGLWTSIVAPVIFLPPTSILPQESTSAHQPVVQPLAN